MSSEQPLPMTSKNIAELEEGLYRSTVNGFYIIKLFGNCTAIICSYNGKTEMLYIYSLATYLNLEILT